MVLDPLSRAEQAGLLAVPGGIDNGRLGPPAAADELTKNAPLLEFGRHPADRILRAIDPCVVMIAANDPLIWKRGPGKPGDDVIERLGVPVEHRLEMDARRSRTQVIRDWQPATPCGLGNRPGERGQQ